MLERDGFPAGVPCWVDVATPDPEDAVRFYGGLFGWEFEDQMPPGAPGQYFMGRLGGKDVAAVGSQMAPAPTARWNTYIGVDRADAVASAITASGGTILAPPFDVLESGRMAVAADPSAAVFSVWQPGTHRGAQLVNAPNTWNWSNLQTADTETAQRFYGAVFGWEASAVGFGDVQATMLRRPGYGEFLEQFDPDLRKRQAEYGAPEGFADAIAWIQGAGEGVPAQWSVTFSVSDADAVAAQAKALGGEVVVPPFDMDLVRIAVLRDPQGAEFTVSRFG